MVSRTVLSEICVVVSPEGFVIFVYYTGVLDPAVVLQSCTALMLVPNGFLLILSERVGYLGNGGRQIDERGCAQLFYYLLIMT